jgi:hypothetical protein
MQARRRAGFRSLPSSLLQNELIQGQIGNRLAQPAVLELKVLQALHLFGLQPTELLAPPIIRHLAHPERRRPDSLIPTIIGYDPSTSSWPGSSRPSTSLMLHGL